MQFDCVNKLSFQLKLELFETYSSGSLFLYRGFVEETTYGFVGDSINMEEYGSIGFGPVSSSSSCFFSSSDDCFPPLPSLLWIQRQFKNSKYT